MPVHDWTRVDAGIFHAFRYFWIYQISAALNRGLLPPAYYALSEQTAVGIRRECNHQVVAMVEVVSPGDNNTQNGLNLFVRRARQALAAGIHLLLVDLFPPSASGPQGIHGAVWSKDCGEDFSLPADKSVTCVAYVSGPRTEAFIELLAVGETLPDMPLFLAPDAYISVPLEATYQSAWEDLPAFWRNVLTSATNPADEP